MLDVWCQKQLIGFSLHCVQSAVTHTECSEQTKAGRKNGGGREQERNQRDL